MDRFITDLMGKMTIREKLGQLNLPSGGDLVTGSVMNSELSPYKAARQLFDLYLHILSTSKTIGD